MYILYHIYMHIYMQVSIDPLIPVFCGGSQCFTIISDAGAQAILDVRPSVCFGTAPSILALRSAWQAVPGSSCTFLVPALENQPFLQGALVPFSGNYS